MHIYVKENAMKFAHSLILISVLMLCPDVLKAETPVTSADATAVADVALVPEAQASIDEIVVAQAEKSSD